MNYTNYHGYVWRDGVPAIYKSDVPVFDYDDSLTPQMSQALRAVEEQDGPSLWHEPHHVVLGDKTLRLAVLADEVKPYVLWSWPPYGVTSYENFWWDHGGTFITTLYGGENDFVKSYTCAYRPTPAGVIVELREPDGVCWQAVVGDLGVLPICPSLILDPASLALA